MRRLFWTVLGGFALALAAVGVVLPVLPTTPLVILGAFAFAKGSPRMARILENHRIFGPIIAEWRRYGAIAPKYKAIAIATMIAAFGASLMFGVAPLILIVQGICMICAALFILTRPN